MLFVQIDSGGPALFLQIDFGGPVLFLQIDIGGPVLFLQFHCDGYLLGPEVPPLQVEGFLLHSWCRLICSNSNGDDIWFHSEGVIQALLSESEIKQLSFCYFSFIQSYFLLIGYGLLKKLVILNLIVMNYTVKFQQ